MLQWAAPASSIVQSDRLRNLIRRRLHRIRREVRIPCRRCNLIVAEQLADNG
jgi:hypothetical protein